MPFGLGAEKKCTGLVPVVSAFRDVQGRRLSVSRGVRGN
jgi:hypothetical protein